MIGAEIAFAFCEVAWKILRTLRRRSFTGKLCDSPLGRSLSAHFCLLLDIMVAVASVKIVLQNLRRVNVKLAAAGECSMNLVLDLKCTVWTRSLRNRVPE